VRQATAVFSTPTHTPSSRSSDRHRLEEAIDQLIWLLDELDDDPDLEDGGDDEPELGSLTSSGAMSQSQWAGGSGQDLELEEGEDEPETGWIEGEDQTALSLGFVFDGEPELGSPDGLEDQTRWGNHLGDRFSVQDGEPSLGAPENGGLFDHRGYVASCFNTAASQLGWGRGSQDDRESDVADEPHDPEVDDEESPLEHDGARA
jgi:hypothetical protein